MKTNNEETPKQNKSKYSKLIQVRDFITSLAKVLGAISTIARFISKLV
ncbi:MAG: hypothetical protein ACSHX6_08490 [Akkermansiaceae bacterium]